MTEDEKRDALTDWRTCAGCGISWPFPSCTSVMTCPSCYAAKKVRDRDFEWWQAICLNDAVAPTPEAAKAYVLSLDELTAAQEREGCALLAEQWAEAIEADLPSWECYLGEKEARKKGHEARSFRNLAEAIRSRGSHEV